MNTVPPARVAVVAAATDRAGTLARETETALAGFQVGCVRLTESEPPDPAALAVVIVLADRACALRIARSFPGPVLFVPDGPDPEAALESVRTAASDEALLPLGVLAAGSAGARNAALSALAMLADRDPALRERYRAFREHQTATVLSARLD